MLLLEDSSGAGGPETTLLETMVLGRRGAIDPELNERFIRIGCAHYLAVSGMHVGMIAVFVWWVGRAAGIPARGCALGVLVCTLLYAVIAEPRPPILRASVMTAAVCAGLLVGRLPNFANALSLAAIAILTARPTQLFDPGFQLSFASVLAIVLLTEPLTRAAPRLRPHPPTPGGDMPGDPFVNPSEPSRVSRAARRVAESMRWACGAALAAWLVATPLALLHFDRFSPWGWLTSPLLLPLVFAVMVASFVKLVGTLAWPALGGMLAGAVQGLASLLVGAAAVLERLPMPGLPAARPPWWLAAVCAGGLAAWLLSIRWRRGRPVAWITTAAAVLGIVVWITPRTTDGQLTMTVLSVGRGTSVVLELPEGGVVLYDAGASGAYDPGETTVAPFLRHRRCRRIDAVLVSHPNLDHFSGLPAVIKHLRAGPVHVTPYFEPLSTPRLPSAVLLRQLQARGHPVRVVSSADSPLVFGETRFEILWPPVGLGREWTCNETSMVIRVSHAGHSVLLTGDIEAMAQARLLTNSDLSADVLLLPHHGSLRHNTAAFVERVGPSVLISSTFVREADSNPDFAHMIGGRRHFSTADYGAVTVVADSDGITVHTHHPRLCKEDPDRLRRSD
jgi:competence protein ComEC